jgi:type II secretory pathway pseudopilin PulG
MSAGSRGFTYIGFLIFVAIAGAGLAAYAEIASHAMRREKEAELLFRGNAYQAALASYYRVGQVWPQSLEQLLEDKRFPMPVRHLRKLYRDPMTGEADWGLIDAPGGGVMGIHSRSEDTPIKTANFPSANAAFEKARTYSDWKFVDYGSIISSSLRPEGWGRDSHHDHIGSRNGDGREDHSHHSPTGLAPPVENSTPK